METARRCLFQYDCSCFCGGWWIPGENEPCLLDPFETEDERQEACLSLAEQIGAD